MLFEDEMVNLDWIIMSSDVHWMASFTDVIKLTEKVDRDVEAFLELGNIE